MVSSKLKDLLRSARSLCVLTGSGISQESGVATFRGADGLWAKFKPEELANFDAFIRNPELVWEWYTYRKKVIHEAQPNAGHYALVRMEQMIPDFTLVTQNVDNLHRRAGNKRVFELHGNVERSYCIDCGKYAPEIQITDEIKVPRCSDCGGMVRPDVVWFGEMLPQLALQEAFQAAQRCEVFLCVGTSGVVYPAASIPLAARQRGTYVVEINTEETELTPYLSELILGKAGEILPALVNCVHTPSGRTA